MKILHVINNLTEIGIEKIRKLAKSQNVIYDLKYLFKKEDTDLRL